jgi:modification methylase
MKTKHTCIIGDSRNMNQIENSSVHLIVTSPPYWQLKDYGSKDQIGFDDSYEDYINNLNLVWRECNRVLFPGCKMVINIGDQFARSIYYGRYKVIPIRTEIIRFCETIGFDYMGAIIWQKKTTMNTTGGASIMGSYPHPRNGILEIDYEYILVFKKQGVAPKVISETKKLSMIGKENWREYFSGHWYFGGERQDKHLAMFPIELPSRVIKMYSFVGENILDPFLGSGTSTVAAILNRRNSIGFELNSDFVNIIKKRISKNVSSKDDFEMEYLDQKFEKKDWRHEKEKLPYIFHDPIKLSKKIDPRKLKFGSKISNGDIGKRKNEEKFFLVKEVLDVDLIKTNKQLCIRLIGIQKNLKKEGEAIEFLKKKLINQHVYLKYDIDKHDDENNIFAYVYMKNKTFINLHLIKKGFAFTDRKKKFNLLEKFISVEEGN